MITCLEISTRAIGNALFEYATLFGVGKRLNLDIRFHKGDNHIHQPTGQKIWQLKEIFDIQTPDITQEEIDSIKYTYTEKRKEYNPEIWSEVKDNTNLIGFFQHEDYFNFCADELKEQLKFKNIWIDKSIKKFEELKCNQSQNIAVHIRRGDYTKPHLQAFHPLLPFDYYKIAIEYLSHNILNNANNYECLVFTDDKEYCNQVFKDTKIKVVDNLGDDGNIIDLCMMSRCDYHIIANSSFSWWGAWLANSKCVIYPHVWFGPGYGNYNIVSNKNWIKI